MIGLIINLPFVPLGVGLVGLPPFPPLPFIGIVI